MSSYISDVVHFLKNKEWRADPSAKALLNAALVAAESWLYSPHCIPYLGEFVAAEMRKQLRIAVASRRIHIMSFTDMSGVRYEFNHIGIASFILTPDSMDLAVGTIIHEILHVCQSSLSYRSGRMRPLASLMYLKDRHMRIAHTECIRLGYATKDLPLEEEAYVLTILSSSWYRNAYAREGAVNHV